MVDKDKKEEQGEKFAKFFAVVVFGFLVYSLFNIDKIAQQEY